MLTFRQFKASPDESWYVLILVLKLKTHRGCSLLLVLVLHVLGSKAEESGQIAHSVVDDSIWGTQSCLQCPEKVLNPGDTFVGLQGEWIINIYFT